MFSISHVAIRWSLHLCFLHILHKIFTLYIWFFFNLCPTPAKIDIHTWHLPLSSDIGGPIASPATCHCLFLITNSIFCLTSAVRPFNLCDCINGFTSWYNKVQQYSKESCLQGSYFFWRANVVDEFTRAISIT